MKRLLPAFALLFSSAPLLAAEGDAAAPAAAELTRLLDEFLAGASRNDVRVHERFWADDLIYTRSAGVRVGKAEILENARSARDAQDDVKIAYSAEDVRIQQYGDTAVLAFRLVGTRGEGDAAEVTHYLNTGTFVRRDGEWRAVAWQSTRVPEPEDEAPVAPPKGSSTLGCDDAYSIPVPLGRIANNAWNRRAAGEYPFRQCILIRKTPDGAEYGWSWEAPPAGDTLISFPQVVLGWKPWDGGTSSHAGLPVRIADLASLRLAYAVESQASGKYNLATTLWLTRTGAVGEAPDPGDIAADVMIWSDGFAFDPLGKRVGHVTIDNTDFELWFAPDLGDPSGGGPRWNYIAYRYAQEREVVALDLKKILEHAAAAGFISADHYVSDVEVGNEVMSGTGETWVKALSLEVVRR